MDADVIVIGAGISGLATAYYVAKNNVPTILLEESPRAGGTIRSERDNGFLLDFGPNSTTLSNAATKELIAELGLGDEIVFPGAHAKKRFILRNGKLIALPMSPGSFLFGGFFSLSGKLRLAAEPFVRKGAGEDESVMNFIARRFGGELAANVVQPFVSGIYAGDATALSMRSSFAPLFQTERAYGSVIGGQIQKQIKKMFARKSGASKPANQRRSQSGMGKLFSFQNGMQPLTDALAGAIGDALALNASVRSIERTRSGWRASWERNGVREHAACKTLVLATPAYVSARLIAPLAPELAGKLSSISYPHVGVLHAAYERAAVSHPLDGFGFLVPATEKRKILGCVFSSSLFANRAPCGMTLLTVFLGGATQAEFLSSPPQQIGETVGRELQTILGVAGAPVFTRLTLIPRAIPQYNIGYHAIIESVESFERNEGNFFFCNNFRGGVSMAHCIESAKKTAENIASRA